MAFDKPGYWVWDMWFAQDGGQVHMFYLHAPKSLGDPDLRHRNARIGRATSRDLVTWEDHGRIFDAGGEGAFDASATWTGSVVRGADGLWWMFYTGSYFPDPASATNIETIGAATSGDLVTWTKRDDVLLRAEAEHYETLDMGSWPEEAWRDPWVFRDSGGARWHMLVTARAARAASVDRGVAGHATSPDLTTWTAQEPLSVPGAGFAHAEVFQVVTVGGTDHLVFSCDGAKLAGARAGQVGGIWTMPIGAMPGPVDLAQARLLHDESLYAGRVVTGVGGAALMAFRNVGADGAFIGGIADPIPVGVGPDGYLRVQADQARPSSAGLRGV